MTNNRFISRTCCLLLILAAFSTIALAEGPSSAAVPDDLTQIEEADTDVMSLDVAGSIVDATNRKNFATFRMDIRGGYSASAIDLRDGDSNRDDEVTARLRFGGGWNPFETLRLTAGVAYICSTKSCDPNASLESGIAGNSIEPGKLTVDEFFMQWFRTNKFDLAVGRLQTRFVARGGVFAKSLDRNNSANTSVNWTDGLHATITPGLGKGWVAHLISEYNDEDGAGSVRRAPLDFSTGDSELTHFIALENTKPWGFLVQRGVDVSYLPDSLLKDGQLTGRREDYWGIVARAAARIPQRVDDRRLQIAGEIGYAPETPTRQATGTGVSGDAGGLAWNFSISLMDFVARHSIGVLYARTEAGWLLSPQYANNEEQIEIRWSWRPRSDIILDARVRQRKDLDQLLTAQRKQTELDYFLRVTWRFSSGN